METALMPTDVTDPVTGEPLYVDVRPQSLWRWLWHRLCLFASIVWRRWEPDCPRISLRTAWDVAGLLYPEKHRRDINAACRERKS